MFLMIGGVPRRFSMYTLFARVAFVWAFFCMGSLIRIRWRDFIKLKNFWLVCGCAISLGNYGVQGSILKRIGGAGAGISFAWFPL